MSCFDKPIKTFSNNVDKENKKCAQASYCPMLSETSLSLTGIAKVFRVITAAKEIENGF